MARRTRPLHKPAQSVRKLLIATGADRLVAHWASNFPNGLIARLLRPDNALYHGTATRRVSRNGLRYDLDLRDYVQWTIFYGVEQEEKSALFSLVRMGDVVIDVGTNVGEVLLNLAKRVGTSGRAIGFEPNPATRAACLRNIRLNEFASIEVHGVALGDQPGALLLGRPSEGNRGADRVVSAAQSGIAIEVTTLDRFVKDAGLDRLDLIKIDVEGFDLNVLRGAERTVDRFKPVLFVELSDLNLREQGDSASDMLRWLEQRGYHSSDAVTGEALRSTDPLDGCFRDIVARRD